MGAMGAVAVAGTAIQAYGQIQDAQSRAEALERDAYLKRLQSKELQERQAINEQVMREQEVFSEARHVSTAASNGVEGSWFGGMIRMRRDMEHNIMISKREADFKSHLLNLGADANTALASDTMTAGYIGAAGSVLSGAGKAYAGADKPSSTAQSLPKV